MIKLLYGPAKKYSITTIFTIILAFICIFSINSTLAFIPIYNDAFPRTEKCRCTKPQFRKSIDYGAISLQRTDQSQIMMTRKGNNNGDKGGKDDNESFNAGKENKFNSNYTTFSDISTLNKRISKLWGQVLEHELSVPPNPKLSPTEFVSIILHCLHEPDDPLPESGYRSLLRSSSSRWLHEIHKSVGAPENGTKEEILASALGSALNRPNNQFGILVNADDAEDYELTFPQMIDYEDGTCWIESRLLQKHSKKLLVIIGWQLIKRPYDSAWTIDGLQWQDFRENFRPGIGREEWMRLID